MTAVAIIPARYGSERFPGKPLVPILGKSLIQRTYEQVKKCPSLRMVCVATDDARIFHHVQGFGGEVFLTSSDCPTGTDRIAALVEEQRIEDAYIINVQGDEPCVRPEDIEKLCALLKTSVPMATLITPLKEVEEASLSSIVKCVCNQKGEALYFSRSKIPFNGVCYRHLGIYGFQRSFLLKYARLPATPLQQAEDLEQLKVLEHGYPIHVRVVEEPGPEVNRPEDIVKVEQYLCKQNSSS